jgi:hypothetical protein
MVVVVVMVVVVMVVAVMAVVIVVIVTCTITMIGYRIYFVEMNKGILKLIGEYNGPRKPK